MRNLKSKLQYEFFLRPSEVVAPDLLNTTLIIGDNWCEIIEVEAYGGSNDPASHAFNGPTPRSQIMFDTVGTIYIYQIYGMHFCFNVVAHQENQPGAVFIRAVQCRQNGCINGPGKFCKAWSIDKSMNGISLVQSNSHYFIQNHTINEYITTSRIGIKKGKDLLWRFKRKD